MLKSLVSPLFLQELKQGNIKKKTNPTPPLPEGYSFLKRGGSSVFIYYKKALVAKVESVHEVPDAVSFHQEAALQKKEGASYTIRRFSAFRWHVMLDGIFQVSKSTEQAAKNYIRNNS